MKTKITILIALFFFTTKLFAGAVTVPIASGATVTDIQLAMSDAVTAGNTDITLEFADGGVYGTSAASDITIAVPAGVTKLTLYASLAVTTKPIIYLNTLTYSDNLMTGGVTFDGLKLITAVASRYLLAPTTTNTPASYTLKNCYVEGYRAVFNCVNAVTVNQVLMTNNIFKSINSSGLVATTAVASTISNITIRKNTFINSGGITSSDYFIDHRSNNYTNTVFNFSQNTFYSPATAGRGFFRLPGNPTAGNYKLNNNLFAPSTPIELKMGYGDYTGITTDADSTNYYSSNYTSITRKSSIIFTIYDESSPSILFLNPGADDFTINDANFVGKSIAGDPRWFPATLSNPVTLSTSVSPENSGTITPSTATVNSGASITVTATRGFGYAFKEWQDANNSNAVVSTDNPYTFTINANTSLVAVFDLVTTYDFTLTKAGSNWGNVTVTPAATNGKYEAGTSVTMTVVPNQLTTFVNWEDNSTDLTRIVTVDGNKSLTANFTEIPFIAGWDFKTGSPTTARAGDYYSDAANKGTLNIYNQDGSVTSWLANAGSFSPSTPCAYLWTSGATFATNRRYFQSTFSTLGYTGIQVNSQMAGSYQHYLTQKMQVSLNGTDFTDVSSLDISTSAWANLNATLSATYENQATVYIRWIANTASTLVGNSTDNDGTAITNIFVYATPIGTQLKNNDVLNAFAVSNDNGQILINSSLQNGKATIYSLVGQKLEDLKLTNATTLSNKYNSGIYLVKFEEAGKVSTQKVIVK